MKKYLLAVNLCVLLLMGCKKDVPFLSPENALTSFHFMPANNTEIIANDLICTVNDTLIVGVTGNNNGREHLVANFSTTGVLVTVNGVTQISGETVNDFSQPVVYTVTAKNGLRKRYTVKLKRFTGLPVININTEAPVISKDDYVNGTMKIDGNLEFTDGLYDGAIQIKGRGNSTWYQNKKPYKIKLPSKSRILGMTADKEWALLANYFDKTLMRNDVAFELSERMGMGWTPRRRFVEVYMNNDYLGNYLLTETVKISSDRLNITSMDIKKPTDTTKGYLVEADARLDGTQFFTTVGFVPLVMKEPELVSEVQFDYIKSQFQSIENHIGTYVDIRSEIDLDSWIKWVIVNEVMRNRDAILFGSCYFFKDKGKINMGPVWDFDLSSGGYQGSDAQGWYVNQAAWLGGMFKYHPYYKQRFKEIWNEKYASIMSMKDYIANNKQGLQFSQKENFTTWSILNTSLFDGQIMSGGYENEVDHLSGFLEQRINWINGQVNQW